MKSLITGASGLVGSHLLGLLLIEDRVTQVTSISRRKLDLQSRKLKQVVLDLSLVGNTDLPESDVAFCCLGTTIKTAGSQDAFRNVDHDFVMKFALAAKSAGVKKFVIVSALGADASSRFFYNKVKGETERDLERLGFESLVILQPSLLLGERSDKRLAEQVFSKLAPVYSSFLLGPLRAFRPVEARRVAEVMFEKGFTKTDRVERIKNAQIL